MRIEQETPAAASAGAETPPASLVSDVASAGPREAALLLAQHRDELAVRVLEALNPARVADILDQLPVHRRQAILAVAPAALSRQWLRNHTYPEGSVGRLMDPPIGIVSVGRTVGETIEQLRGLVDKRFITYAYVVDAPARLCGVLVMRDLLFAERAAPIESIMVRSPFFLRPEMPLLDAMRQVAAFHYPAYPVCDDSGRIVGIVRGQNLFEAQAFEISAQAGSMVGVDKEERLATPWTQSLKLRHPWLQLNLLTAFMAGAVVSAFEHTVSHIVLLAVFMPILSGQSTNTGVQTLAVTLRGMTLGDLRAEGHRVLLWKEARLGLANGVLVGVVAAVAMLILASWQGSDIATGLAGVVLAAMTASCLASSLAGALVPLVMVRLGADPVTASSILVTTAAEVISIALLLGLAAWLLL
ncbi:MAG: magnesium transporter [Candidatus Binatia bacterium]